MENIIKIEELRIGNYICVNNNGHPCRVTELTTMSCTVESIKENNKEPYVKTMNTIPLTEEWLLKFGFEKNEDLGNENINWELPNSYYFIQEHLDVEEFIFYGQENCIEKQIKYVHQLQNLYFALTNEELTMK